LMTGK